MRLLPLKILISFFLLVAFSWLAACSVSPFSSNMGGVSEQKPTKVALLLPLQGQVGASGQAVRNGFLTAYYYAKQNQPQNAPAVSVVDTSGGNIINLYQQAVAQGAEFVVGPLTKEDLQSLASQGELNVPTLALNALDNDASVVANLYQYGLSPKDEAVQAAVRAKQDGHQRVLVIYPANAFGQGIAQAFQQQWQSQGGTVVGAYGYQLPGDLSSWMRNVLQVTGPKRNIGARAQRKSRQDMDMIFLVAFPSQARQIQPLLGFYNEGNIPVYATSLIYSGSPSPQNDQDLNGIEFSDMPWILGPETPQWNEMRNHMMTLWPDSYNRSPRLYALGIDAYHLTYRLAQLKRTSGTLSGTTGILSVNAEQRIKRQLQWAKMQDGSPQLIQ